MSEEKVVHLFPENSPEEEFSLEDLVSEDQVQQNTLGQKLEEAFLIKQKIDGFEEQISELKSGLEQLKLEIYKEMDQRGLEKIECAYGSAKSKSEPYPNVKDWNAYMQWIADNKRFEMVERRPARAAFREHLTSTGEIPPGLDVFMKDTVELRKKAVRRK